MQIQIHFFPDTDSDTDTHSQIFSDTDTFSQIFSDTDSDTDTRSHNFSDTDTLGWPRIWIFLKIIAPQVLYCSTMFENHCDFFSEFFE